MSGGKFVNAPICERCWFRQRSYRPVRTVKTDVEKCSACGWPTVAGIFVRQREGFEGLTRPHLFEVGDLLYTKRVGGEEAEPPRVFVVDNEGTPGEVSASQVYRYLVENVVEDL